MFGEEQLDWLRRFLPFRADKRNGFPDRQSGRFGDERDGAGAPHRVSAYAHEAGLVLAARAVETKGNEITAIPELLDLLAIEGAIVTIDAIGTQKAIARKIVDKNADYVLALKENQGSLYRDVADFFADPALASACPECRQSDAGHGRVEERHARAADAVWLAERHPQWAGLRSIAAITAGRTDKKTGETSTETRLYISSLPPDPAHILGACRSHWSIENNLHWQLDVTFREDECRTRTDNAATNLAMMRRPAQPAHSRAVPNPHQAKTPQSRHQPAIPNRLAHALTIHDLALAAAVIEVDNPDVRSHRKSCDAPQSGVTRILKVPSPRQTTASLVYAHAVAKTAVSA